jgi:hypothetical protein
MSTPQQLERGQWLYIRVATFRNTEGVNDFGLPEDGGAHLCVFPFDFFLGDASEAIEVPFNGGVVRLYPPFRNQKGADSVVDQVIPDVVPGPLQFGPVATSMPALEKLHLTNPLGNRADAFRLDFIPDPQPTEANEVIRRLVDWIRVRSGQWWIGQARHYALSPLRNWFSITAEGQPASGFHSFAKMFGGFGTERAIGPTDLEDALKRALRGEDAPFMLLLLFDAIYHYAAGDHRRSLLDAATAIEAASHARLAHVAARDGVQSRVKKPLRPYDLTVLLDQSCRSITGRSFRSERPSDFERLKELRTARGNTAHGQEALTSAGTRITSEELRDCLMSTVEAVNWLGAL